MPTFLLWTLQNSPRARGGGAGRRSPGRRHGRGRWASARARGRVESSVLSTIEKLPCLEVNSMNFYAVRPAWKFIDLISRHARPPTGEFIGE